MAKNVLNFLFKLRIFAKSGHTEQDLASLLSSFTLFVFLSKLRHLKGTVKGNKLKYLNKTFGDWFVLHQVKKHSPFREKFEMKLSRLSLPRSKDSFTLATVVYGFRSRLCQRRDRKFHISLRKCNFLLWNLLWCEWAFDNFNGLLLTYFLVVFYQCDQICESSPFYYNKLWPF